MKLLLDTHTFIWGDSDPAKLSKTALALCSDPDNQLMVSVAFLGEIQIKRQLGKLDLRLPLAEILTSQQEASGVAILPIASKQVQRLEELPAHHRDSFDRLLVAQALAEAALLVSGDPVLRSYPAEIRWQDPSPASLTSTPPAPEPAPGPSG